MDHRPHAEAVGDKAGGVLGENHPACHAGLQKGGHRGDRVGVGVRRRDQLQKLEVARRIKEVRAEEALAERLGTTFGEKRDLKAARVGGDHRVEAEEGVDALEQRALGVEVFDDRLAHPIGLGHPFEVLAHAAQAHLRSGFGKQEMGRPRVLGAGKRLGRGFGGHVEQRHLEAEIGQVRGDSASHRAGAQHAHASGGTPLVVIHKARLPGQHRVDGDAG